MNENDKPLESSEYVDLIYLMLLEIKFSIFRPFQLKLIDETIIKLRNRFLSLNLSKTGSLTSVHHAENDKEISFTTNLIRYSTSLQPDRNSGAYLFLPDGEARDIPMGNHDIIRIQRGPLVSRIDIFHEMYSLQYKLTNTNGQFYLEMFTGRNFVFCLASEDYSIALSATTHLTTSQDIELAVRFTTGINNGDDFFTDLNGFQVGI